MANDTTKLALLIGAKRQQKDQCKSPYLFTYDNVP